MKMFVPNKLALTVLLSFLFIRSSVALFWIDREENQISVVVGVGVIDCMYVNWHPILALFL